MHASSFMNILFFIYKFLPVYVSPGYTSYFTFCPNRCVCHWVTQGLSSFLRSPNSVLSSVFFFKSPHHHSSLMYTYFIFTYFISACVLCVSVHVCIRVHCVFVEASGITLDVLPPLCFALVFPRLGFPGPEVQAAAISG